MRRLDPLLAEALRGLAGRGEAQLAWLGYLALQALVLFAWWPKGGLVESLEREAGPATLTATAMALGAALAYYSLRAGAEEILLPGQHPLREWVVATPLSPARILAGYLAGHLVQIGHALALSAPLLLVALSVSGGASTALAWSLTTAVFQATFYRLVGAISYMTIGHHGAASFVVLRAALLLGYVVAGALLPVTSHVVVTARLLGSAPVSQAPGEALPPHVAFLLVYGVLAAVLAVVLHHQLARQRRVAAAVAHRRATGPG